MTRRPLPSSGTSRKGLAPRAAAAPAGPRAREQDFLGRLIEVAIEGRRRGISVEAMAARLRAEFAGEQPYIRADPVGQKVSLLREQLDAGLSPQEAFAKLRLSKSSGYRYLRMVRGASVMDTKLARLAEALARGVTLHDAFAQAGVSRATGYRLLRRPLAPR